jgi:phage-related tail protein
MIEKIQNRPEFKAYDRKGVTLPKFEPGKIREAAVGAGVVLGGLGGAAAGTAGGFAAAGATTSAVMALGAASTGTAISSLSGAAATNATLAAIGGGALEAGGGGIALGTSILGGMTLGVGLLVGGVIFSATGSKMSDKADEAWRQMREAEKKIDKACEYLDGLTKTAGEYTAILQKAKIRYDELFQPLNYLVTVEGKTNWSKFTAAEKRNMENLVLLVGLLYKMCQVQLVLKQFEDDEEPQVNYEGTRQAEQEAEQILKEVA